MNAPVAARYIVIPAKAGIQGSSMARLECSEGRLEVNREKYFLPVAKSFKGATKRGFLFLSTPCRKSPRSFLKASIPLEKGEQV